MTELHTRRPDRSKTWPATTNPDGLTTLIEKAALLRTSHALLTRSCLDTHSVQECRSWHEEETTRDGMADIQQMIVISWRIADKHIFEHLLNRRGRATVSQEISAEFAVHATEGHVVTKDLDLLPVLNNRRQRIVGKGGLRLVAQFNV